MPKIVSKNVNLHIGTGCGTINMTFHCCVDTAKVLAVTIETAKSGACIRGHLESITHAINGLLRLGTNIEDIPKIVFLDEKGHASTCPNTKEYFIGQWKGQTVTSCQDAVVKLIKQYLEEGKFEDKSDGAGTRGTEKHVLPLPASKI